VQLDIATVRCSVLPKIDNSFNHKLFLREKVENICNFSPVHPGTGSKSTRKALCLAVNLILLSVIEAPSPEKSLTFVTSTIVSPW